MTELERLCSVEKFLLKKLSSYGLRCIPQRFDIIPDDRMFSILAARLPANFSFWQFGRDYERLRTEYEYGHGGGILEVVFNLNPSRAYTLKSVPFSLKVATFAHVFGHNDFFSNNVYIGYTRKNMLSAASAARERFLEYEKKFGIEEVEKILTAAKALELNIDPDLGSFRETQKRIKARLLKELKEISRNNLLSARLARKLRQEDEELRKKVETYLPFFHERDILFFIIENSPFIREIYDPDWRAAVVDMLSVCWEQARYFAPQRETKIMNEGWATLWHQRLMRDILTEGLITSAEFSLYAEMNGNVLANHPLHLNPYLLGSTIWESVEERWNKGRFGKEYELCTDKERLKNWDTKAGLGKEKIFSVRETHTDWRFIDEFLTQEIVDKISYYIYRVDESKVEIATRNVKYIKELLLSAIGNTGHPLIKVKNGNHKNKEELMLHHVYDGRELDDEYRIKTMEHIFAIWGRTVKLRTNIENGEECIIYSFDGKEHQKYNGCKKGECIHL